MKLRIIFSILLYYYLIYITMKTKKQYIKPEILVEEWKVYKEVTGKSRWGHRIYEVSNFGRVKINGIITEPHIASNGYKSIGHFLVHRAVAELFIPNPDDKPCVDHIDTNTHNNVVWNLRWVTPKENSNNPLTQQHRSETNKRPEVKQKRSEAQKEAHNRPKVKQKQSEIMKKVWARRKAKETVSK